MLVDKKDSSKGFKLLSEGRQEEEEGTRSKKGKGRASRGGSAATAAGSGTVDAAGLVDGSWVAYRIRNANGKVKDEQDEEEEYDDLDVDMEEDPGWDVVVPSFEEADAAEEDAKEEDQDDDIPIPDVGKVR